LQYEVLNFQAEKSWSWLLWLRRFATRLGFSSGSASAVLERRVIWAALGMLTLFHIVATLSYSLRRGRLSVVPYYDDVSYLLDALERLKAFDVSGLWGFLWSLIAQPPHAPLTAIITTLGFAITPNNRLGSYALAGLWVLPALALAASFLRGLPKMTRAGVICSVLALPMLSLVVGSIRPDTSWGLLAGCAAVILATTDLLAETRARLFLIGILVGMVGLAKPTGMPAAMTVMGVAYLGAVATAIGQKREGSLCQVARGSVALVLGTALLLLPYLALDARGLWTYIRTVMIDDYDIWRTEGSLTVHFLYYLSPAPFMMGWLWPVGIIFLLGNGVCAIISRRTDKRGFVHYLSTISILLTSYIIPSISPLKSLYVGGLFYGTASMVMVWNLGALLRRIPVPPIATAIGGLLIFITFWRPSTLLTTGSEAPDVDQATRALAPAVLEKLAQRDSNQPVMRTLVTSPGPVFDATFKYLAMIKQLPGVFIGGYFFRTWDELLRAVSTAEIVIVTDLGAVGQGGAGRGFPYPSTVFQDQLMQVMEHDRSFQRIASYSDSTGHRTIAFFRRAAGVRITRVSGFRGWEGPFPHMSLPVVSWMTNKEAELELSSQETIDIQLDVSCQSPVPTTLQVEAGQLVNRVAKVEGPIGGSFTTVKVPISLEANTPALVTLKATPLAELAPAWPGPLLCTSFVPEIAR
jgi:hypothetical protein